MFEEIPDFKICLSHLTLHRSSSKSMTLPSILSQNVEFRGKVSFFRSLSQNPLSQDRSSVGIAPRIPAETSVTDTLERLSAQGLPMPAPPLFDSISMDSVCCMSFIEKSSLCFSKSLDPKSKSVSRKRLIYQLPMKTLV
uniref:Uncharacterized protein n=1 Tax=Opuntia streptacantha TaxID=393608 RepID=A0A7C8Z3Y9_OPUST